MSNNQEQTSNFIKMPLLWPARFRFTLFIMTLISLLAFSSIILKQKIIQSQLQNTRNLIVDFIGNHGFELQDIIISGRSRTQIREINQALHLKRGDNFLDINPAQVKQALEDLPWIRDVTVKRSFFPNVLQINIKEKEVLALWQLNQQFYPLDFNGYVIEAEYNPDSPILLIVGEEAPEHLLDLLQTIRQIDASYLSRLKAAVYVSKRRWNLIFNDINQGITVKLPAENFAVALTKLINLDKSFAILKRKLTIIDLRLPNKTIVKMRKGGSLTKTKGPSRAL